MTNTPGTTDRIDAPEYRAFVVRRRWIVLVLALAAGGVGALAVSALRSPPHERAAHFRDLGVELTQQGDAVEAERFFRQAIEETPDDPTLHALLGELLLDNGREEAGLASVREALERDPAHPRANELIARRHFTREELEQATECIARATAARPAALSALALRAEIELARGRPEEAAETWDRLAERAPDDPRPHLNAGFLALALERLAWDRTAGERARAHFERAARLASAAGHATARAHAQLALGRAARALETLDAAAEPTGPAVALRAAALQTLGRREEAAAVAAAGLRRERSPAAEATLALALSRAGHPDRAADQLGPVGEGTSYTTRAALREIRMLAARANRPDDLLVAFFAETVFTPNPVEGRLLAGAHRDGAAAPARRALLGFHGPLCLASEPGSPAAGPARRDLDQQVSALIANDPHDAVALFWMHVLDASDAPDLLDRALRTRPDLVAAHVARSLERSAVNDHAEALESARIAREHDPRPATEALLVRALLSAGRTGDALAVGREARERHAWDPTVARALLAALAHAVQSRPALPAELAERNLLTAIVALARGDRSTATRALLPVLESIPRHPEARALMARAWEQVALALDGGATAEADDADQLRSTVLGALALEQAGRRAEALELLRVRYPIEHDPACGTVLAEMLERDGDRAGARLVLEDVAEHAPHRDATWLALADLHARAGDAEAAREVYRRVIETAEPGPDAARAAHSLLEGSPSPADTSLLVAAVERWRAVPAMQLESSVLEARLALAGGRPKTALDLAEKAAETDSERLRPRILRAVALAGLGELGAAEEALAAASRKSAGHPGIRRLLSDVRTARAEQEMANGARTVAARRLVLAIRDDDTNDRAVRLLAAAHRAPLLPGPEAISRALEGLAPGSAAGPLFRGLTELAGGTPDAAQATLEEALAREPDRIAALEALVVAAGRGGSAQRALDACDRFERVNGSNPDVGYLRAVAQRAAGFTESAEALLTDLLREHPAHVSSADLAARIALERGDRRRALEIARAVEGAIDREGGRAARVASLLVMAGDTTRARNLLDARLTVAEGDTGGWFELARLELAVGQPGEAQRHLERVITARPRFAPAYFELLRALQHDEGLPAAQERFSRLVVADSGNGAAWCVLGMLAQHRGAFEEAERCYTRAEREAPGFALALNNRAWVLAVDLGRPFEALSLATKAVQLDPGNGEYRDTLGWTYFLVGNLNAALAELDEAVRLLPASASVHWHRARTRAELGQTTRAAADYRHVLELDPDFAARNDVARALHELEGGSTQEK